MLPIIFKRFIRPALVAAMLAQTMACVTITPDPGYAPVQVDKIKPPPVSGAGLYQENYSMRLFQDIKAYRVGDILTVQLVEQLDANKSASTSATKSNSTTLVNPTLFGRPVSRGGADLSVSIEGDREFNGEGDSSQSNSISGSITVMVSDILPNGYLVVRGEKMITINQGDEFVRLSGIIRPVDIKTDNTVLSTQVANARIIYGGRGAIADANAPGWLSRFFLSKWWPF